MFSIISKKGDLPDMLVFIITALILAIGLFTLSFVIPTITDKMSETSLNDSAEAREVLDELSELGQNGLQKGYLLVFFGLIIGLIITSFLSRTHPIFMFLYIIFLILTAFVGGYLGNAYEQFITSPAFESMATTQGYITVIMSHIVEITIAIGALSMMIVFARFRGLGGGGSPL